MKKAAREHFIIDGYNVIHDWPELIALRDNLEFARDRLIDWMAEYGAYEDYEITIVFDAPFTRAEQSCEKINERLQVVFTDEGETADSYIEKLAYQLVGTGRQVHVVTSDGAEQAVILGAGAYRISSREMRRTVKKAKRRMMETYVHNPALLSRRELGGRIHHEVAKKMDEIRKRK